jgi:hypothetical protein
LKRQLQRRTILFDDLLLIKSWFSESPEVVAGLHSRDLQARAVQAHRGNQPQKVRINRTIYANEKKLLQQARRGRIFLGASFFEKSIVARTSKFLAWLSKT